MYEKEENEEKVLKYMEAIQQIIVSLLFKSKEFQELKKEMEKEGYEIQEGIFAFLTKELNNASPGKKDYLKFQVTNDDKNLLKEWGISIS